MSEFRSGFVNIIGKPNVGKSTLMNALVGERMSIITNKPQTTRHRIFGIVSGEDFQMVFSDTPGYIQNPNYKMQERMNSYVQLSFEDADLLLWLIDPTMPVEEDEPLKLKVKHAQCPVFLVINKKDLLSEEELAEHLAGWKNYLDFEPRYFCISALNQDGTEELMQAIKATLPEGPEYFPQDQLTDRPERFFVAEIVREQILLQYHQEIPYSCEVLIDSFKEDPERPLVRIHATIYVSRNSQKPILIGDKGKAIKQLGIASRERIEQFLEKQVHLELFVKVKDNWRDDERLLNLFGYGQ